MHSFPFLFCLVCPLTQCNILISVMWSLFSYRFFIGQHSNSLLHLKSCSCTVKFSLKLEWYLLVMHNTRDTLFHPPCLNPMVYFTLLFLYHFCMMNSRYSTVSNFHLWARVYASVAKHTFHILLTYHVFPNLSSNL